MGVTDNSAQVAATIKRRLAAVQRNVQATINRLSVKMQANILNRPGSPASAVHRRKGWLANSVRIIPATAQGGMISGGVQAGGGDAWYAKLFEDGTSRSYRIVAKNAKALRFQWHPSGQYFVGMYFKRVIHPAFDAGKLAFMHPVAMQMKAEIDTEINAAVVEALQNG